jgi:hypothetical protein
MKGLTNTQGRDILKILNIDESKPNKTIEHEIQEAEVLKHRSI